VRLAVFQVSAAEELLLGREDEEELTFFDELLLEELELEELEELTFFEELDELLLEEELEEAGVPQSATLVQL